MKKEKKFSLLIINSSLLVVFLIMIICAILTSVYFTTQKVIDYNINEYFKQTNNFTNIILDNEKKSLNNLTFEISKIIQNSHDNISIESSLNNLTAVDQIDLLFFKTENEIVDYSTSLFDSSAIIKELEKVELSLDNLTITVNINDEDYVVLLSTKKIIDSKTGKVKSQLFVGKLINDNFTIANNIKQKAFLDDVHIFSNNNLIVTTSNNEILDFSIFDKKNIVKQGEFVYFKRSMKIYNNKKVDLVFVTENRVFDLLKDEFISIGYFLLIFVVISFIILYLASNKYIIKPFSELIQFAQSSKDNKNIKYKKTNVLEIDNFAIDLKSIIDELRELKEQYLRAIEGVQDGLWDYDFKTKELFCSNRYLLMLGYKSGDNRKNLFFWKNSIHPEDYMKTLRKIVKHTNGYLNLFEDDYRVLCKNGSYKWIKVRGKIFFDEYGRPLRMTGFHTDIDDIIRLQNDNLKKEQMLYQQNKLASMGEMIGNIAHQWRQPLNIISTIASSQIMQLELGLTKKEETIEDLNKLIDTVHYLSEIIEKFRYFFNPNKELEHFYIDDLINDNQEIFEASYKINNINLIMNLEHIEISGYKFELLQVIINIISNARDALIERYNIDELKFIFMDCRVKDNYLVLKIYDNAQGIKESLKSKIYEPYFTTKHQSQGTGLGLYMSNEIIKKHFKGELLNETIDFEYKGLKYTGEEFSILLPM